MVYILVDTNNVFFHTVVLRYTHPKGIVRGRGWVSREARGVLVGYAW